ncbi:MAG: DUF2255 family protein [Deltaproteobacteria bacterium]|nr:MAG: DUF2255 family protein [Deltaproteobacteria bacterium]
MRQIMLFAAVAISVVVGAAEILGRGEVVEITTVEPGGTTRETPLWIVTVGGDRFLRAGSPNAQWLARIEHDPVIWLEVDGVRQRVEAVPLRDDRGARDAVNRAMAEKYGFADTFVGALVDPANSVPILLRPHAP